MGRGPCLQPRAALAFYTVFALAPVLIVAIADRLSNYFVAGG